MFKGRLDSLNLVFLLIISMVLVAFVSVWVANLKTANCKCSENNGQVRKTCMIGNPRAQLGKMPDNEE